MPNEKHTPGVNTYPDCETAREELLKLLGVQGGTCHLLPYLIRVQTDNGVGANLLTRTHFIRIVRHEHFGNRVEVFAKYRFIHGGIPSNGPTTEDDIAYDKCNPNSPREYIDWRHSIAISTALKHWLINYYVEQTSRENDLLTNEQKRELAGHIKDINSVLVEALRFYADPDNYDDGMPGNLVGVGPDKDEWQADSGHIARAAIANLKES